MPNGFEIDTALLNEAPEHWTRRPLWTLMKRREVSGFPSSTLLSVYRDYGVVPRASRDDNFNRSSEDLSLYKRVQVGDLVLNKMKTWQGSIATSEYDGIVSPAYYVCTLSPEIYPRFAHHALRSLAYVHLYRAVSKGIRPNQWDLPFDEFRNLPLALPPMVEQVAIADYIDRELATFTRLEAARRQQLSALDERDVGLVNSILRQLSTDYPLVRLGYLARIQTGLTLDSSRANTGASVTRPYLRVANVQAGFVDLTDLAEVSVPTRVATAATLKSGDVLMTEGGDLDKLGRGTVWKNEVEDCLHQNHVFAVRPGPNILPEYLALLTRSTAAREYFARTASKTTNLASTSSSKIRDFRIPLVGISDQRAVVDRASQCSALISHTRAAIVSQLRLLGERRLTLTTTATMGRLNIKTAHGGRL